MPLNQKVPAWFTVPAVLAVLSIISYQTIIAPENLEGTNNVLTMAKTIPIPVDDQRALSLTHKEKVLMLRSWTAVFSSDSEMISAGLSLPTHLLTGTQDVFLELSGFPDNIRRNSNGEFWIALHLKKGFFVKLSLSQTWFKDLVLRLRISGPRLHSLFTGGRPHATAVKLSESGEVLEVLEDKEGKRLRFISEVEEKDGKLWIGYILMPFLGVYDL